jgi:hypothetical protein
MSSSFRVVTPTWSAIRKFSGFRVGSEYAVAITIENRTLLQPGSKFRY